MVCDVRLDFEILDSRSRCLGIEEEIMGGLMRCFAGPLDAKGYLVV